jgi:hypothetical protein
VNLLKCPIHGTVMGHWILLSESIWSRISIPYSRCLEPGCEVAFERYAGYYEYLDGRLPPPEPIMQQVFCRYGDPMAVKEQTNFERVYVCFRCGQEKRVAATRRQAQAAGLSELLSVLCL